jgi:hypothetical protein
MDELSDALREAPITFEVGVKLKRERGKFRGGAQHGLGEAPRAQLLPEKA